MIKRTETMKINKMLETNSHIWDNKIAFSVEELHIMLGIPRATLCKLCREGEIKTFKIGRHYRIARADLYAYIERQKDMSIVL